MSSVTFPNSPEICEHKMELNNLKNPLQLLLLGNKSVNPNVKGKSRDSGTRLLRRIFSRFIYCSRGHPKFLEEDPIEGKSGVGEPGNLFPAFYSILHRIETSIVPHKKKNAGNHCACQYGRVRANQLVVPT